MYFSKKDIRSLQAFLEMGRVEAVPRGQNITITAFRYQTQDKGAVSLVEIPSTLMSGLSASTTYTITANTLGGVFAATVGAVSYPLAVGHFPLAQVVVGVNNIDSITDLRSVFGFPDDSGKLLLTTKGDIIGHDGTDQVRLPVGANGLVLTADSSTASGLAWSAGPLPGAHASSHRGLGADPIPLADGSDSGLLRAVSASNRDFLSGNHLFIVPPTVDSSDPGYIPAYPNNTTTVFLGDGTYGLPSMPYMVAEATGDAGNSQLNWNVTASDGVTYTPVTGPPIERDFTVASTGLYMVSFKATKNAPAGEITIEYNGTEVDRSGSANPAIEAISCTTPIVVTDIAHKIRFKVVAGSIDHSVNRRNRIFIYKIRN